MVIVVIGIIIVTLDITDTQLPLSQLDTACDILLIIDITIAS